MILSYSYIMVSMEINVTWRYDLMTKSFIFHE